MAGRGKKNLALLRHSTFISAQSFRLYLFGHFRLDVHQASSLTSNSVDTLHLPTRKCELLLAYLALYPGEHPREAMAALFWGDVPDAQARISLRKALTLLRRQLGAHALLTDRETVQLNPALSLWVDVQELCSGFGFSSNGHATPDSSHIENLGSRIELYRGDLLSDFYDEWILSPREHYRSLYLDALLRLAKWSDVHSDYDAAIDYARRALEADRANECAHQLLMSIQLTLGNHHAALKQYDECKKTLKEELSVEPSAETSSLYARIQSARGLTRQAARVIHMPNPLTSFVGREREIADVQKLLSTTRLLTLTGAGGCGKTRLAIQVARALLEGGAYKDGAWWVELQAVTDAARVSETVAKAMGMNELPHRTLAETLVEFLRTKDALLLLDNCEHLVEACAQLSEILLQNCPHLSVLATSRQALNLAGEVAWIVPSLSLPNAQDPVHACAQVEHLIQSESIRLFVDRAQGIRPGFTLDEHNAFPIAQICRRLDGIPLAIELAVARMRVLSAEQIAARLDDRFSLLTSASRAAIPRHQTLRAAMDWSYAILSPAEQVLFRRSAVFAGGWTLEAVEAVCSEPNGIRPADVLDLTACLVDKSLIIVEQDRRAVRYRMLETIREYALEELLKSGEQELVRDRHLEFFLEFAERAEPQLLSAEQVLWFKRFDAEHDNFRAALEWSRNADQHAMDGLRLASALGWYWRVRGYMREGRERLRSVLAQTEAFGWTDLRARALNALGFISMFADDWAAAVDSCEQALAIARSRSNKREVALALFVLGGTPFGPAEQAEDNPIRLQSLALWRELGDKWGMALTLNALGEAARARGDYGKARPLYEESLLWRREIGDTRGIAVSLVNLGLVACYEQEWDKASTYCKEGMTLWNELGVNLGIAECLTGLAGVALGTGRPERAARLLAVVESLVESSEAKMMGLDHDEFARLKTMARAVLREDVLTTAWAEGRAMSQEQAVEYALANA